MNYGYAGTKELNEALVSRFAVIRMPMISKESLVKLIKEMMINSGAMQNTLAALPAESANQTVSQLSALWTTPAPLFFVSGIERISAIILHIGLSLLIYRAVKAGKCRTAAFTAVLAYGIHFIVDFFAVAGPALLPIYVIEIGVFVMAAGTLVMALKMGRMEEL